MPEIKHNFMKGKMNKDLDERLIPNGEYRDAMNIQVSTSEGSDVGTVQNVLGNSLIKGQEFIGENATCVGSIADEKNNKLYYFTTSTERLLAEEDFEVGATDLNFGNGWTNTTHEIEGEDVPLYGKINRNNIPLGEFVVGTEYEVSFTVSNYVEGVIKVNLYNETGDGFVVDPFEPENKTYTFRRRVEAGVSTTTTHWSRFWIQGYSSSTLFTGDISNISVSLVKNTIVEYDAVKSSIRPIFVDTVGGVLKFEPDNIITGINIIDDLLIWTDNVNEPRKININRSKKGTHYKGLVHTSLIVEGVDKGPIREEHITVIKKSPSKAPGLGIVEGSAQMTDFISGDLGTNKNLFYPGNTIVVEGDEMWIGIQNEGGSSSNVGTPPSLAAGDIIRLYNGSGGPAPEEDHIARLLIKEVASPGQFYYPQIQNNFSTTSIIAWSHQTAIRVSVSTLIPHSPVGANNYYFELEQGFEGIFERKFPRFACRYKYEDNEYSSVGPFSEVVFIPKEFKYHPTKAYNEGMINDLKELTLKNFVATDIPDDVVQVDLLYKNEFSPNIYVIKTIDKGDTYWNNDNGRGSYVVPTENVFAQIPSDQLVRPWDNVPKTALAQEVTGNRVVYGNYSQGYDLVDDQGAKITPNINATLDSRAHVHGSGERGIKSLKSQRTYNVGIVYGDEYGRETPVFTNDTANQLITKSSSASVNALAVSVNSEFPAWADYYKIFIKETSNEYYNLAMGRMYDAEDSNVWISFPSVDRNKIDEDTYLILKKGVGKESSAILTSYSAPENPDARYKVVAIENEAPDFIKTEYTLLAEVGKKIAGVNLFGGVGVNNNVGYYDLENPAEGPTPGSKSFTIDKKWWEQVGSANWELGLPSLKDMWDTRRDSDMYVSFSNRNKALAGNSSWSSAPVAMSNKYKVTSVEAIDGTSALTGYSGHDLYRITIDSVIPQSESFLTDYLATGNSSSNYSYGGRLRPHFYKKEVLNKPEFDGRFFVKIIEDDLLSKSLRIDEAKVDSGWEVTEKISNVYYLQDGATNNTGNTASTTPAHWQSNLGVGGRWFVDETSYAGGQPAGNGHPKKAIAIQDGVHLSDITSSRWFAKFNKGTGVEEIWNNTPTGNYYYPDVELLIVSEGRGSGQSEGAALLRGAHAGRYVTDDMSDLNTDAYKDATATTDNSHTGGFFLSLSYSGIDPHTNTISSGDSANAIGGDFWNNFNTDKNWVVGEQGGSNSHTASQADVVSNLAPNKLFRFAGDNNVYKIIGVTKRRLYNYMGSMHWGGLKGFPGGNAAPWSAGWYDDPYDLNGFTGLGAYVTTNSSSGWVNGPVNLIEPVTLHDQVKQKNYTDYGFDIGSQTSVHEQHGNMTDGLNCRVNYLINYEVLDFTENPSVSNGAEVDISSNTMFAQMDNDTSRRLEFVTEFSTTKQNKLTKFPAIFETEPKEDLGLDIYYEATGRNSTRISPSNIHNLVPIGAIISNGIATASGSFSGTFVSSITQVEGHSNLWRVNFSQPVASDSVGFGGSELRFYNDNGGYSTATLQAVINPAGTNGSTVIINGEAVQVLGIRDLVGVTVNVTAAIVEFTPNKIGLGWFNCWSFGNGVESNRIGDTYNKPYITNGVKASTTLLEEYKEEHRKYGLIYSGIYNSTSGVNSLNQFIAAEKITKDINPTYGSIQKLYSRSTADGDLITLCEDRVLKILANKDALYNADGNPQLIANNNVLGQTMPFSGDYGISKNPESFVAESYRVYFTDKVRGAVMRLSKDGLTPISDHGMKDWFRDNLRLSSKLIGSYDDQKDEYNITLADRKALGEELITNGNFEVDPANDWTQSGNGLHWTWSSANKNVVADADPHDRIGQYLADPVSFGKSYEITYTIGGGDFVGRVWATLHDDNGNYKTFSPSGSSSPGKHKAVVVVDNNFANWAWGGSLENSVQFHIKSHVGSYFNGTIDNVSVKEVRTDPKTVSFKEDTKGWVSFKSFVPENALSMSNNYYSMLGSRLHLHHDEGVARNNFYGVSYNSSVNVVLNDSPGTIKTFHTLNYEGGQSRVVGANSSYVDGNIHPNGSVGRYFWFNLDEMDGLYGNTNWAGSSINVKQYRDDVLIFEGAIITWGGGAGNSLSPPSGGIGKGHSRRVSGSASGQFEVGDVITTQAQEDYNAASGGFDNAPKKGWYASKITTDKQSGSLLEFIEKEGKWFNYVKGTGGSALPVDFGASNVQGVGSISTVSNSTIKFGDKVNISLQVGDTLYAQVGVTTVEVGEVSSINGSSVVVATLINTPSIGDFVFFVKDSSANVSSLLGYYADVKFENNSRIKAELFSVGSEVSESSK